MTGTAQPCIVGAMRYKRYPYYVVLKNSGLVVAAAEYREDAAEMRLDLPEPPATTQVLTAAGVERKYGAIKWARA